MKQKSILLVDDEDTIREPMAEILTNAGFKVATARDGSEALNECKRKRFDLIVTDVVMPGKNGVEVIRGARKTHPSTQVIVMSGYATAATHQKIKEVGAFGFLEKPVRREPLLEMVLKATSGHGEPFTPAPIRSARTRAFHGRKALVADDNEVFLDSLSLLLSDQGYDVTSVSNGNDAYEVACLGGYDLAILDFNMPRMTGGQAIAAIRRRNCTSCIVLTSGEAESKDISQALKDGADAFLPKPFRNEQLLATLKEARAKRERENPGRSCDSRSGVRGRKSDRIAHFVRTKFAYAFAIVAFAALIGAAAVFFFGQGAHHSESMSDKMDQLDKMNQLIEARRWREIGNGRQIRNY